MEWFGHRRGWSRLCELRAARRFRPAQGARRRPARQDRARSLRWEFPRLQSKVRRGGRLRWSGDLHRPRRLRHGKGQDLARRGERRPAPARGPASASANMGQRRVRAARFAHHDELHRRSADPQQFRLEGRQASGHRQRRASEDSRATDRLRRRATNLHAHERHHRAGAVEGRHVVRLSARRRRAPLTHGGRADPRDRTHGECDCAPARRYASR